jgi:hypothetical protein
VRDIDWAGRGPCIKPFQHFDVRCPCAACDQDGVTPVTVASQVKTAFVVRGDFVCYRSVPGGSLIEQFESLGYGKALLELNAWLRDLLEVSDAEIVTLAELTETLDVRDAYRALRMVRGDA